MPMSSRQARVLWKSNLPPSAVLICCRSVCDHVITCDHVKLPTILGIVMDYGLMELDEIDAVEIGSGDAT